MVAKLRAAKAGDWVRFTESEDGTWFEVLVVDGFNLYIRDKPENNMQVMDSCYVIAILGKVAYRNRLAKAAAAKGEISND